MKHSRIPVILAILLLGAFFVAELLYFLVIRPEVAETVALQQEYIYPGRKLNGIDVSGFSKDELQDTVEKIKEAWFTRRLTVSLNGTDYSFTCKDFGISFPEEAAVVASLFRRERKQPIWEQYAILKGFKEPEQKEFMLTPLLPEDGIKEIAEKLSDISYREKQSPSLAIEEGEIHFEPGQAGFEADAKELEALLETAVKELLAGDVTEMTVAYAGTVTPLTGEEQALGEIDTCIASFSTEYIESSKKGNNVRVSTGRLDQLLLYPGESASVNELILARTRANGYLHAPIYINGQQVEGMGGGVCQVSSTLYGALLRAGIIPDERHPHSMVPPYIPMGLDAAIYQDKKDLVFTNTLSYPIYICGNAEDGILTFEIWSDKDALEGYTYEPYAKKLSAHRAKSYLKKYLGDTLIETIELYTDWYRT